MSLTSFHFDTSELMPLSDMMQMFYERNGIAIATAKNDVDALFLRAERAEVDLRLREAMRLYREYLDSRPNDLIAWEAYLENAGKASDMAAVREAMAVLREAGLRRPEAASYFLDYAYQYLEPNDGADYGLAAIDKWPLANIMYQTHRNLLFAGRVDEARDVQQAFAQRYGRPHPLMIARQLCAEGDTEGVRKILAGVYGDEVTVNSGNPQWLVLKMLGEEDKAVDVLRNFEARQVPFLMASWLSYTHFDPSPFPALMAILTRENVERPPATTLPYACTPK
jgi:hypothetical protein